LKLISVVIVAAGSLFSEALVLASDWRNIRTGFEIPSENYADQPYAVVTKDGNWLCTLTTGPGNEGQSGQHVVATISSDKGQTWSELIDIEPAGKIQASWVMPLITPSGRVYAFYDYNGDNVVTLPNGKRIRTDTIGWYCYRYSDDNGRSWSERYRLPVRVTACDRANNWAGRVQIMWGIGEPIINENQVFFGFTKLGRYILDNGEGWFFRSDNILTESDVPRIQWHMLPDGDHGLRAPEFGSIQEEHNLVALSNGDLYCMYRTTMGHPCHSYSRDGGHRWSKPEAATYTPGGRTFKHPRACPRIWRTANGKFLFWFHNHGGKDFKGRNPAWICGGTEKEGFIHWSQPEILLYDPDPQTRISYPDLIEQDGRNWITETQKQTARVHEIDSVLLEGLWRQGELKRVANKGLILSLGTDELRPDSKHDIPELPNLATGAGFTIELWLSFYDLTAGQIVLDCCHSDGKGLALTTTEAHTLRLDLNDGEHEYSWDCDPGLLKTDTMHHIVFIIDGGPKIISILVDGVLCDGGVHRQYGWGRFPEQLSDINGTNALGIAPAFDGRVRSLRIYNRSLRTSEAIGNFRAGL
jgi:hypothetical protein